MSSILTNSSAMTALKTLQMTNSALETTQSRISTGLKVNEASDNAAYWSIATTMRSDNSALGTVKDALGLGAAKVDVASTGLNAAIKVVDQIKTKLVAASEPGVDKTKIQSELKELQLQLRSISDSASFSGENWLSSDVGAGSKAKVVSSFTRDDAGGVKVGTLDIDTSSSKLFDTNTTSAKNGLADTEFNIDTATTPGTASISTIALSAATTEENLTLMISGVDAQLQKMTTSAADLGASKARISMQNDFVSDLMGAIEKGISTLVDADMTKESTRLSALQTQQQLGIQSLSIANGSAQSILSLFR